MLAHHYRHEVRLVEQAGRIEYGLQPRGAVLVAVVLRLRSLEMPIAAVAPAHALGATQSPVQIPKALLSRKNF
jgi:hypothetical protein